MSKEMRDKEKQEAAESGAMVTPVKYLWKLFEEHKPAFRYTPDTDWQSWRKGLKAAFAERIGLSHDCERVQAPQDQPVLLERVQCEGYVRERVEWTTHDGLRMPVYVLIPDGADKDLPAVVALHGHGYGSREIVGLEPDGSDRQGIAGLHKDFAVDLVKQGFVVAAPELLGFGDRRLAEDIEAGPKQSSCFRISAHLMMLGQSIAGVRVTETMQAVGYLMSRPEVNPQKIGCMGISGGGLIAAFTAGLDERIGATVVSGYANTFEDSILERAHCLDNYIPGVLLEAEMPELIGLIAPRGLLIESGDTDMVFPRNGTLRAYEVLSRIYEAAGASEALETDYFTGGHEISGAKAYEWLKRL
jgi:dienelactone hydrolase